MRHSLRVALVVGMAVAMAACGSGSETDDGADDSRVTDVPTGSGSIEAVGSTAAPGPGSDPVVTTQNGSASTDPVETDTTADVTSSDPPSDAAAESGVVRTRQAVTFLASDELMGRDDRTEGSQAAQDFLIGQLATFAAPAVDGSFRQDYGDGTNLIGIVPGGDLGDEYVLVGAHYDHLGGQCRGVGPDDGICNGATDNATGVVAALEVARAIAASSPRRSVVIALWDGEEDGLIGSARYVEDPVVPLDDTAAYVNFDIQGSNLLPSLSSYTVMVGAETGGQQLVDAALAATADGPLDTANFSLVFGQGRSDHANLAAAGVPSVFFTDANNGCYHTVHDDIDAVDFEKLDAQIATATRLALDLASTDTPPVFVPDAPLTVYDDAVELLGLVAAASADFALLGADGAADATEFRSTLDAIVERGADAYDDAAVAEALGGAARFVEYLANTECRPAG